MSKFKKSAFWLYMLNKRLYKKPSFVAILAGIVILSLCLSIFADEGNVILRVAICSDGGDVSQFVRELKAGESIIHYELFSSREEALHALEYGGYDCVWALPADISSAAKHYAEDGKQLAEVIQREDSVFLRLARERLYAALYPYVSKAVYDDFISDNFAESNGAAADVFYDDSYTRGDIVNIGYINSPNNSDSPNMVLAPMRGILALAVFICAYSALMNFKKDRLSGMYSRVSEHRHIYLAMLNILLASANAGLVTLIAFAAGGIFGGFALELISMLVFLLTCVAFCTLIGELVSSVNVLAALMPVISIIMLVVCPIFLNMKSMESIRLFMPPYYYLMMGTDSSYILYGLGYAAVMLSLSFILNAFKMKRL